MENIKKIQARLETVFSDSIPTSNTFFTFAKASFKAFINRRFKGNGNINKPILMGIVCCLVYQNSLLAVNQAVILRDLGSNVTEATNLGLLPLIQSINIPLPPEDYGVKLNMNNAAFIGNILYPNGCINKFQTIDYRFILPILKLVYTRSKATNAAHANTVAEIKKLQTKLDASISNMVESGNKSTIAIDTLKSEKTMIQAELTKTRTSIASLESKLTDLEKKYHEELLKKLDEISALLQKMMLPVDLMAPGTNKNSLNSCQ